MGKTFKEYWKDNDKFEMEFDETVDLETRVKDLTYAFEQMIKYNNYLCDNLTEIINYSNNLATKLNESFDLCENVISFYNLKYHNELNDFLDLKESGVTDNTILKTLFRKNKIQKIEKMLDFIEEKDDVDDDKK